MLSKLIELFSNIDSADANIIEHLYRFTLIYFEIFHYLIILIIILDTAYKYDILFDTEDYRRSFRFTATYTGCTHCNFKLLL